MVLACLALLALTPAAQASIAYVDENGVPRAQGEPGEANDMSVRSGEEGVIFSDTAGIRPRDEDGCRALSPTEVVCAGDGGILLGEDGNDTLRDAGLARGFGARGGPGDDRIYAGAVDAIIYGDDRELAPTDGDDTIVGSSSQRPLDPSVPDFHDTINGGGGNDDLDGGPGNDEVSGQAGNDTVRGGDGDDNLDNSSLLTTGGQDAPGDDGDDTAIGGAGNDVINAGRGRDSADGGAGDDLLVGIDLALGRDDGSSDTLDCGAGADRIDAGAKDKVYVGCETLRLQLYCSGVKTCKATGGIAGKAKGAKKTTTVAKINRTVGSGDNANLALGKKATKLLGSASKVTLSVDVALRNGRAFVGGQFFRFSLLRAP